MYYQGSDAIIAAGNTATGSYTVTVSGAISANSLGINRGTPTLAGTASPALTLGSGGLYLPNGSSTSGVLGATTLAASLGTVTLGATQNWANNITSAALHELFVNAGVQGGGMGTTTLNLTSLAAANFTNQLGNIVFNGVLSDGTGGGRLALNVNGVGNSGTTLAAANTFTGGVTMNSGTMRVLATSGSLASSNALAFTGTSTFNYDNTGTIASLSQNLASLSFSRGEGTLQSNRVAAQTLALTFGSFSESAGATANLLAIGGTNGTDNKIVLTGQAAGFINQRTFFGTAAGIANNYAYYDAGGFLRGIDYGIDAGSSLLAANTDIVSAGGAAGQSVRTIGAISAQTDIASNTLNITGANSFTLDPAATLTLTNGGLLKSTTTAGGTAATISSGVGITTGGATELVIRADQTADNLTISTPILASSTGGVTKAGAGTVSLGSGGVNAYSGATTINAGTFSLLGSDTIPDGSAVNIRGGNLNQNNSASGGILAIGANSDTVGAVQFQGGGITGTTGVLTGTSYEVRAGLVTAILGGAGVGLTKNGVGTVLIASASGPQQYTGATTINGGQLTVTFTATQLSNTISASSPLVLGGGTLTLANENTHAGETAISGGMLALAHALALSKSTLNYNNQGGALSFTTLGAATFGGLAGAQNLALTNAGAGPVALTVGGNGANTTYSGVLSGAGSALTKAGNGTLILSGANTYTGGTTVSAGILKAANLSGSATGTGPVLVSSGATLLGTGTISGAVTVASGGIAAPGMSVGTLSVGSITISAGAILKYEFSTAPSNDRINVLDANGLTIDGGSFFLFAENTTSKWLNAGTYHLFQFNGAIGGAGVAAFTPASILNPQAGLTYSFGTSGNFVDLTITGLPTLTTSWAAPGGGNWSDASKWTNGVPNFTGQTANFLASIGSNPSSVVLDGTKTVGTIEFDNAAAAYTIAPGSGTLRIDNGGTAALIKATTGSHAIGAPVSLLSNTSVEVVDAAKTLTISGAIDGAASLSKTGPGTLVLSGANGSYTGSTELNSGTLEIVHTQALGTGTLNLTGNNTYSGTTTANAGVLALPANGTISGGAVQINAGGTLTVSGGLLNANGVGNVANSAAGPATFNISSGLAVFNAGLNALGNANQNWLINATGGLLTATSMSFGRSALSYTTEPTAGSTTTGLYINGAAVSVTGALNMSTSNGTNSSVSTRLDSGSLTVDGPVTIGLNNTGRWSVLDINGGTFTSTDLTNGVFVGAPAAGNADFLIRAGIATVEIIKMGQAATGTSVINLTGGSLYVGSGGILQNSTVLSTIKLAGGTLGAKADWASTIDMQVNGSPTVKAADIGDVAHDITLGGALSGAGTLTKTGAGKLTLGGAQSYPTLVAAEGRTDVSGAFTTGTSTVIVANNATVNFGASQTLAALDIGDNSVVTLGTPLPPAPPEAAFFAEPALAEATAGPQAVPEPGSAALILGGILTLLGLCRRA